MKLKLIYLVVIGIVPSLLFAQDGAWPGNDLGTITCPNTISIPGSTVGATSHCTVSSAGDHTYQFTVVGPVDVTIATCTSGYDTEIHLFNLANGDCNAGAIGSNDDGGACGGNTSLLTMNGLASGTYVVVVEGWNGSEGDYDLDITTSNCPVPPATADDAWPGLDLGTLSCPSTFNQLGSTAGAVQDCGVSSSGDHIYQFSVVGPIDVDITLCNGGTTYDTEIHLFDLANGDCAAGAIASNNDSPGCGTNSRITSIGLATGSYVIVIEGDLTNEGDYDMNIILSNCPPEIAPGGLGTTNLSAWFKAGDVSEGDLTTWSTTYPIGGASVVLSDAAAPYAQISATPVNNIFNYNTVADFDGNSSTNQKFVSNTNALNLLTNQNVGNEGTFFTVFSRASTPVNDDGVVTYKDGQDGIQLRSWGRLAIGHFDSNNGTRNFTSNPVLHPSIIGYSGNKSAATSMYGVKNDLEVIASSASSALMNDGLTFGAKRNGATTYNEYFDGFISEVIFFNSTLNVANINKVNSYLGIKYGITLENTGGGTQGDYVSSSGSLIWDASLSALYHNDVIGIGQGINQGLEQKQSHSLDDSLRIYVSTLQTTNDLNSGSIINDDSYAVVGNNKGFVCATAASLLEMPAACALYSRLEREWKLTKTNFDQSFSLDIKLNDCANTGLVDPAHLRLLVDDDGDFSNGGTNCYLNGDVTGIVISYNGPVITVSNLSSTHFANNDTRYFTIGSILSSTPLPITLTSFKVDCSLGGVNKITWVTKSEINNDYFAIEKSSDGLNWYQVTKIKGNGTTSSLNEYHFTDTESNGYMTYYRLKQTDFDGTTTIVGQTKVECENNKPIIYPNPFNDELFINFKTEGKYFVVIRDVLGRIIFSKEFIETNSSIQYLDLNQILPKGMYYVSILQNEKTILLNEKIVKN